MASHHRLFVVFNLALAAGCAGVHTLEDAGAPTDDARTRDDAGAIEECPDFSCEARCAGISVCNCLAPGGEADCARRGGRCDDGDTCVLADGGPADGGLDAGRAHDAGPGDAGGPTPGVPCGASTCEAAVSFCMVCQHWDPPGPPDAHCEPVPAEGWVFTGRADHLCDFPGVFAQCDGPEDCTPDRPICTFSGGEWGYGQCWGEDEAFGAVACHTDSDCADGARCGEVDPLGYFSPLFDTLGWRPRACGGASAEASAFCDRFEVACGLGEGSPFWARDACLGYLDGLSEDAHECAFTHLAEAEAGDTTHCEHAADPTPCDP